MTDLLLFVSLIALPPPGGRADRTPHKFQPSTISRSGRGGRGRGGGAGFIGGPRPAENSVELPSLVPGWLRPGGAFPLYSKMITLFKANIILFCCGIPNEFKCFYEREKFDLILYFLYICY